MNAPSHASRVVAVVVEVATVDHPVVVVGMEVVAVVVIVTATIVVSQVTSVVSAQSHASRGGVVVVEAATVVVVVVDIKFFKYMWPHNIYIYLNKYSFRFYIHVCTAVHA